MLRTQTFLVMVTVMFIGISATLSMAADRVVVVPLFTKSKIVAPVAKTGQTSIVPFAAEPGSDGNLQKGVAWPTPRFTGNSNGTVTDNLTGLIWLANANCTDTVGGIDKSSGSLNWTNALTWSNNLADGDCGLTDSSKAGDWRLPNIFELESLRAMQFYNPAISNDAGTGKWAEDSSSTFSGVEANQYWSSTTFASHNNEKLYVNFYYGYVDANNAALITTPYERYNTNYVWPVRD